MQPLVVNVDGINVNASHYGAMSAQEGPKRILQDHHHLPQDQAWAEKVYTLCAEKVNPKPAEVKAEAPAKAKAATK